MKLKLLALLCFVSSTIIGQQDFGRKLSNAAIALTENEVTYDGSYFSIPYPNGDIPADKGVCTDVIVRAYRTLEIDLQELVHQDMKANFHLYPKIWGLSKTDTNIDHRRVPNLMTYFKRFGTTKKMSENATDYAPGDIVAWRLENGLTHIGVVVHKRSKDNKRYLISHNIGAGQVLDDCLFDFTIIGHYSFPKTP
ncbi:DUF1287 domain-containing protein [Spongiivirga sp. MCCC 1A20706]|uniref:DUF1287 domain-containing protein n=1 Tax=Spongiivirga sp. MCCC 1A20706 TaxID=3160963 RepID=UPI00397770FA